MRRRIKKRGRTPVPVPERRSLARRRRVALVVLLLLSTLLTACPKAVQRVDDQLLGRVSFEVEPGWELTRNYRWLGSHHVQLSPAPPSSVLTVDLIRTGPGGEQLPLDLVAEGVVGQLGRKMGMRTIATGKHEIELAGRRAIALTGTRHHGPHHTEFTAWVARTPGRLLIVQLQAPPGQLEQHTRLLTRLLESFELPLEPPPPDTLDGA